MSNVAEKLANKTSSNSKPAKAKSSAAGKQVRLKLVFVDMWSATRLSFLVSLALSIAFIIAAFLLWQIVDKLGLFAEVDSMIQQISGSNDGSLSVTSLLGLNRVLGFAMLIGIVNTVLGTILGGLAALLYNFSVRLTGGLLVGFTNAK